MAVLSSRELPVTKRYEDVMLRNVNDTCVEFWNLYINFDDLNESSYEMLTGLVNSKNLRSSELYKNASKGHEGTIMVTEERSLKTLDQLNKSILKNSESLCHVVEVKFPHLISKFERLVEKIKKININHYMENMLESDRLLLSHKINEAKTVFPIFLQCIKDELSFKTTALKDIAYTSDHTNDISIGLLAAWKHYVFIDYSLINRLYSIAI
uniref:Uncharacterized protein n=1 Tax=Strongyloides venezuelensis TaxID=75913 RepID=A0A0K0FAK1_STRVS